MYYHQLTTIQWQGDLYDYESLVKVIKLVDVVISAVSHTQAADQVNIIVAIKEAGNVKVIYLLLLFLSPLPCFLLSIFLFLVLLCILFFGR
jgi:hypothetical protein